MALFLFARTHFIRKTVSTMKRRKKTPKIGEYTELCVCFEMFESECSDRLLRM